MNELQEKFLHQFSNPQLLKQALSHKSYVNETKEIDHNEKLEFLGDAVLDLVLAEMLYFRFPGDTEGELSKRRASLVNETLLSDLAKNLELDKFMLLSRGEAQSGGAQKPRLLASTYEALIGALYLDAGLEISKKTIQTHFENFLKDSESTQNFPKDYKTRLQEEIQKKHQTIPSYELLTEEGPSHERIFHVQVSWDDNKKFLGSGRTKKAAEQEAAQKALQEILIETESKEGDTNG